MFQMRVLSSEAHFSQQSYSVYVWLALNQFSSTCHFSCYPIINHSFLWREAKSHCDVRLLAAHTVLWGNLALRCAKSIWADKCFFFTEIQFIKQVSMNPIIFWPWSKAKAQLLVPFDKTKMKPVQTLFLKKITLNRNTVRICDFFIDEQILLYVLKEFSLTWH